MAHHVHRATGLGAWVLINENWYKPVVKAFVHRLCCDLPSLYVVNRIVLAHISHSPPKRHKVIGTTSLVVLIDVVNSALIDDMAKIKIFETS